MKRKVEIFSAGCACCDETVQMVTRIARPSCEVVVLDMQDTAVSQRATRLGIRSVPAVVINGATADCCAGRGPTEQALRAAGIGEAG